MTYQTTATSSEVLAQRLYHALKSHGIEFAQLFPYNRFNAESTTWWACESGAIPAYSRAKIAFTESRDGQSFFVGLGVEKGYEQPGLGTKSEQMNVDWDWHTYVSKVRSNDFESVKQNCTGWKAVVGSPLFHRPLEQYVERSATTQEDLIVLLDYIHAHPKRRFIWCDLYIGIEVSKVQVGGTEDDLLTEFLIPLIQWFWPGLQTSGQGV
jgi:hypothetical protein